jgi:NAD(P)-dependent dehydrogenase (short-subunit alcohol dehydrogenase family)
MIAVGFALARRLDPHRVSVNSVHPGTMMPTKQVTAVFDHSVDDIETGVNAIENLVTNPALAGVSGRYFNKTREAKASAQAHDTRVQERAWEMALRLSGAPAPELSVHDVE